MRTIKCDFCAAIMREPDLSSTMIVIAGKSIQAIGGPVDACRPCAEMIKKLIEHARVAP